MIAIERLCNKLQELYGNQYEIIPFRQLLTDYTTSRQIETANGIVSVVDYTSQYSKLRKEKIIGAVNLTNPQRVNADFYYLTSEFTIQFTVPINNIKKNIYNEIIEQPKFDFFGDYEKISNKIINKTINFGYDLDYTTNLSNEPVIDKKTFIEKVNKTGSYIFIASQPTQFSSVDWTLNGEIVDLSNYGIEITYEDDMNNKQVVVSLKKYEGKMIISEPIYANQTETDGDVSYGIFNIKGTFSIGDCANFGNDYEIYFHTENGYIQLDGVNSFVEILNNDGSAIVYENTTKSGQNLGLSGWVATLSINDIQTDNSARKLIYETIHLNKEFVNNKRKVRVKIITPQKEMHLFNAIMNITFRTGQNNVGSYEISLTDDNRPSKDKIFYKLSFNTNGGSEEDSKIILEYEKIGTLPQPIKAGYNFIKWQIDNQDITSDTIWYWETDKTANAIFEEIDIDVSNQIWQFNELISFAHLDDIVENSVNFINNDIQYSKLTVGNNIIKYDETTAYNYGIWALNKKTITFGENAIISGKLYNFIVENAIKQGD